MTSPDKRIEKILNKTYNTIIKIIVDDLVLNYKLNEDELNDFLKNYHCDKDKK